MEKKKKYLKPKLDSEMFVPNEYVAGCAESITWKISCNMPLGHVYIDANGNKKYDNGEQVILGGRTTYNTWSKLAARRGCGHAHDNITLPPGVSPYVPNAMFHPANGGSDEPIFYWVTGNSNNQDNIHATKGEPGDIQKNLS